MKVLVTGANGFLGSTVVRYLLKDGYNVRAFIRKESRVNTLANLPIDKVTGDITHPQDIERAVDGCAIVFHLASAYTFYPWWEKKAEMLYKINVDGTRNVLAAALKHKVERFIFTSSVASIGKQSDGKPSDEETPFNLGRRVSHYARSKVLGEREVLKFCQDGLPAVILNPAVLIGERDYKPTPSGEMIVNFLNKKYPYYFEAAVSVADVDDVAQAHIAAVSRGRTAQRYILCNSRSYTIEEIFALLENISGVGAPRKKITYPLLLGFLYIDEAMSYFILKKKPLMPIEGVKFCKMSIKFDNSKAIKELGYIPTPIRETLKKAVNWYRENGYVKAE